MNLPRGDVQRYLALLGVEAGPPTFERLRAIVRTHLWRVPFENISKLYRMRTMGLRGMPAFGEFLEGIEQLHFGGTCYTNNFYLNGLLRALGYEAVLCGATMSRPDVHLVSLVRCDGREYIIDAGNAAPFIEPLPADLKEEHYVPWGADRYIVHPKDERGWPGVSVIRDGERKPQYTVDPAPRTIEEFTGVIADSFRPEAVFMNAVLIARFAPERSIVLRNRTLTVVEGEQVQRTSYRRSEELIPVIEDRFGIPKAVARVALEGLSIDAKAFG